MIDGDVLIVVAHPDDEVLGCGGTMYAASEAGHRVGVCVLSGQAEARKQRPGDAELKRDFEAALERVGAEVVSVGQFPNIEFNTVPHLEITGFVEQSVRSFRPTTIITHHPGDLNVDHQVTSHCALVAARLDQRTSAEPSLKSVLLMEVLSATDWSYPQLGPGFTPTAYVQIGEDGLGAKLEAVSEYANVMRPFPHSRSHTAITALAQVRGAESGLNLAEAFEVAMIREW